MKLLLDTNAFSALMRGRPEVANRVRQSESLLVSSIVAAELYFSFRNGNHSEKNQTMFESFIANPFVTWVPVTLTTADRFARIAVALRKKGRPIPTNDIWIAAQTLETGAELLSYNQHFENIEGLPWIQLA